MSSKTTQKLVYSKDYSLNSTVDNSITGVFKSSASLSKSLNQRQNQFGQSMKSIETSIKYTFNNSSKNSFSTSAKLILGMERPKNNNDIQIRNLTHFYDKLDNNENTYEMLYKIKLEKRKKHLDTIEDFEDWRLNFNKECMDKLEVVIKELKNKLLSTKNEINTEFSKSEQILIKFVQNDISNVERNYLSILKSREDIIQTTYQKTIKLIDEFYKDISLHVKLLIKNLNLIGFLLFEENDEIMKNLTNDKEDFFNECRNKNENTFEEIHNLEEELINEAKFNFQIFTKKWKNTKLNNYLKLLRDIINSCDFVDNPLRKQIVSDFKKEQIEITNKRLNIVNKLLNLPIEEITQSLIENIGKECDNIYNTAQNVYDKLTSLLVRNSDLIYNKSLEEIELFKKNVLTIDYSFGIDNVDSDINDYGEINNLDELIEKEINPILQKYILERKEYNTKIIAYIDDYDDYYHNNCIKLISFYTNIGIKNDEHKKFINENEKKYLLDIAKCTDDDEDTLILMEEKLKEYILQMKNGINKEELDLCLHSAIKVIDEMEKEYRTYFDSLEHILDSHESRILDTFHNYEAKILSVFGIVNKDKLQDIQKRRKIESEYLSKRKEYMLALEEEKLAEESTKGKGAAKKKPPPKQAKKGENLPQLIPAKEIKTYSSTLKFEYLIDYTITEYIQAYLRNIIYGREDDILNPDYNIFTILESEVNKKPDDSKSIPNLSGSRFLDMFNPYEAPVDKIFISPESLDKQFKLLSENNFFTEKKLEEIYSRLFNTLINKIKDDLNNLNDVSNKIDNERREEALSELDIRLKSLAPRKGKIEVEEYDKRIDEVEKHLNKFEIHYKIINERNNKDKIDNENLLKTINNEYNELNTLFEKLNKGMDEEINLKGVDDKYKKFKTSYYELENRIQEIEIRLRNHSKINPEQLIYLNNNFLLSLLPYSKGGTYSPNEITFYETKINEINQNMLINEMNQRETSNNTTINEIRNKMNSLLQKIENKYHSTNENIMAKECIGNKFGATKRLANDIIINIKMKCNQSQDGIEKLLNNVKEVIDNFNKFKSDKSYVDKCYLSTNIRKYLLTINNCVYNYGKYIDAFKTGMVYNLSRISLKELNEVIEITAKDELEEDEKEKINELDNLGLLSKTLNNIVPNVKGGKEKDNNLTFQNELSTITDKVKLECQKLYTGDFAKIINNNEKINPTLIPFIQKLKTEMENFRLKSIRDLRTYCQELFKFSLSIPSNLMEYIYLLSLNSNNKTMMNLESEFEFELIKSEKTQKVIGNEIGPYLANPHYLNKLEEFEKIERERHDSLIDKINKTQFNLIENEEKNADEFFKRLNNNFEAFIILFDNFIFEEEFISLGDEEYFKERKDYNFLLKLKSENKPGLNLDSKRTFKKIFNGLDKSKVKINNFKKFKELAINVTQNNDDKIKLLEDEYNKETLSKNITGLNTKNNKLLSIERTNFFEKYSSGFFINVDNIIDKYNTLKLKETDYYTIWNNLVKDLKNKK